MLSPSIRPVTTTGRIIFFDMKTLSGLAYGAIHYPFTKVAVGTYSATYADALNIIYKRANYNASKWNTLPFAESYKYDDIEQIMESYAALVAEKKIPVLVRNTSNDNLNTIVKQVALKSGRREDLVRVVLYEAYWAAYGNPVAIPESMLTAPMDLKEEDTSAALKMFDTVKWIAILGIGAFALSQIVQLKKATSE